MLSNEDKLSSKALMIIIQRLITFHLPSFLNDEAVFLTLSVSKDEELISTLTVFTYVVETY